MSFQLSSEVDGDKVFLVNKSDIKGRLEPKYFTSIYLDNEKRLYEANERLTNIGRVTTIVSDGTHFTPKYQPDGVKFVSVKDVRKSEINLSNTKFISLEEADHLDKRCKPKYNDILLTKIGTFGLAAVVKTHERFQLFVSVALLRVNEEVMPEYLEIFLNSGLAYLQYSRIVKGAGVPDLHLEDIKNIKILIPEKSKQQSITDYYFRKYDETKQKEAQAKQLLNSIDGYLLKELGIALPKQEENTLKSRTFTRQLSEVSSGRLDPNYHRDKYLNIINAILLIPHVRLKSIAKFSNEAWNQKEFFESFFPYIEIGEIDLSFGEIKNINQVEISKAPSRAKMIIRGGDILVSTTRPSRGAIVKIEKTSNIFIASTGFAVIRSISTDIDPIYLHYILRQSISLKQMEQRSSGGNYPAITQEELGNIVIPLPPIEKQTEIAQHIANIRQQAKQLQQEAKADLAQAKKEVEAMILGEA